jgi:hypothetical protein
MVFAVVQLEVVGVVAVGFESFVRVDSRQELVS